MSALLESEALRRLRRWEALPLEDISRREFLKQARNGFLGIFLLPLREKDIAHPAPNGTPGVAEFGRVLDNTVSVYKEPSFSSKLVNMYWRDLVLPIDGVTIGDNAPEHNRVWYLVNNHEGYVHSGKVQPVAVHPNQPLTSVPETGILAEVSVPFTDARKHPDRPDWFAYRLYYSSVFWITRVVSDKEGAIWYQIRDDKYKISYYVSAEHLRPIPAGELSPISPHVPLEEKRLEVRLKSQVLVAYQEERPVFMTRIASGGRFIDGDYSTPTGQYMTNRKRPSRHMASGDLAAPNSFDLPGVPWVCYLTKSGISFHGTYWHNDFGKPRSHGCLNLSPQAAHWVYRWTAPAVPLDEATWADEYGTRVDVVE